MLEFIAGAANAAANAMAGFQQADIANKNYQLSKQNLEWQKEMQAESWRRDDTAVQRRAADMGAAGINPLLAAGSAAGNSPVVHTEAPQMDPMAGSGGARGISEGAKAALSAMSMSKDFAVKDAQAQVLQAQAANVQADTQLKTAETSGKVMQNDVYALNNAFDLDTSKALRNGLLDYNKEVFSYIDHFNNKLVSQQALTAGERARNMAMDELVASGVDKASAEALSAGYAADIARNELTISGATVPSRIAGAYVDVAAKGVGTATSLNLQTWLKGWLQRNGEKINRIEKNTE